MISLQTGNYFNMEYVKNLFTDQINLHDREIGRANNQGHAGKVARLREELRQLHWAFLRLRLYDE